MDRRLKKSQKITSSSENEYESTEWSFKDESQVLTKEFGEVRENESEDCESRDPDESGEDYTRIGGHQPIINERVDFIIDGKYSGKKHSIGELSPSGNNLRSDKYKDEKKNASVDEKQESFVEDGTLRDDKTLIENKGRSAHPIQKAMKKFRGNPLEEDYVLAESFNRAENPTDKAEAANLVLKNTCQSKCEQDPKEKALRYLEESGVLRLFQNLAAGIVHDRPEKPLLYMIKCLEQKKKEDWRDSSS